MLTLCRFPGFLLLLGLFYFSGCQTPPAPLAPPSLESSYQAVDDSLAGDPEMESFLEPYRQKMMASMGEVISYSEVELIRKRPESLICNWYADTLLEATREYLGEPVDLGVFNYLGLRNDLPAGPVTRGEITEVIPFENDLVILSLTGSQIEALAQEIMSTGGEPFAGMELTRQEDQSVQDIRVGGQPLDPGKTYTVLTLDYLADGNGPMTTLFDPQERNNLYLHYRDLLISYLQRKYQEGNTIHPRLDNRIKTIPSL